MRHLRRKETKDLVVVDPCMRTTEVGTYNLISEILSEFHEHPGFSIHTLKICAPNVGNTPLADVLRDFRPAGVISLGSFANVTDNPPWLPAFAREFEERVFAKDVPMFGICFTHQFYAHHMGERVGYVENRHALRERKWVKVRDVRVDHPKMRLLLARLGCGDYMRGTRADDDFRYAVDRTLDWDGAMWKRIFELPSTRLSAPEHRVRRSVESLCGDSFQSWARHEQEVKGPLRHKDLMISATSAECAVEGLIHKEKPIFTLQTHPETAVGCPRGYCGRRVLKNFIYYCHLLG
jgi:GMP synthase-like glutamine amidotransferase